MHIYIYIFWLRPGKEWHSSSGEIIWPWQILINWPWHLFINPDMPSTSDDLYFTLLVFNFFLKHHTGICTDQIFFNIMYITQTASIFNGNPSL